MDAADLFDKVYTTEDWHVVEQDWIKEPILAYTLTSKKYADEDFTRWAVITVADFGGALLSGELCHYFGLDFESRSEKAARDHIEKLRGYFGPA